MKNLNFKQKQQQKKRYLFSTNGVCLNVFSVSSGELVYRLSYSSQNRNQSDDNESLIIKSICINPTNKYQLLSFHLSGRVCLWDYEDGLLLKVLFCFYFTI